MHRADTVRFVSAGALPHDVAFRSVPDSAQAQLPPPSPLMAPGEKWDLVLSVAAPFGKYVYVCTPHEVLGVAGTLYVAEGVRARRPS